MTYYKIQLRYDTLENWEESNPVLSVAEAAYVIDTGGIKVGNGFTPFTDLDYIPALDQTTISRLNNLEAGLELKVDKVEGKGLSTEDFTTALKNKLEHINWSDIEDKPNIPTKTSDLTNDSGYISTEVDPVFSASPSANITSQDITSWNNKSDFSGNYNDLTHKPNLSTVATTGDYNDLSNKPTIPTDYVSYLPQELTEDQKGQVRSNIGAGASSFSGDYNDLTNKPTIPTKTSELNNDSGFITQADVLNYKSFPSGWHTTGSIDGLISDINNDSTALPGMSYLSTVSFSDLPASLIQGEIQVDIMSQEVGLGKVIRFTLTSSNTAPYHWEYTSAYGASGTWRGFVVSSQLATVATTGDYSDLSNTPTIPAAQVNSDWNSNSGVSQILNKPSLASVATSGDYNDLSNTPSIPDPQVQADWTESDNTKASYIKNKPSLPSAQIQSDWNQTNSNEVDYIKNKPTIPTVPTNVSDFNNDAGYITTETDPVFTASPAYSITSQDISDWNGKSDFSGSYNDLTDKPTIPDAQIQSDWNQSDNTAKDYIKNKPNIPAAQVQADWDQSDNSAADYIKNKPNIPAAQVNSDWNSNSGVSQILNKPSLATVATSGAYSDLTGTPTIPASPVQSNWNESDNTSLAYIQNKPTIPAAPVQSNWNESDNTSLAYIQNKPTIIDSTGSVDILHLAYVAALPASPDPNTVYFILES